MKKLGLVFIGLLGSAILVGCSSNTISSNYADVEIGDAVAKRLTNGEPAVKEALKSIDTYADNQTSANSKDANKKVKAMVKTFHDNTLADETDMFDELIDELQYDQDNVGTGEGATPKELKGAVSTFTAAFVSCALPSKYQSYKNEDRSDVIKQYLKDLKLKPTEYWADNILE